MEKAAENITIKENPKGPLLVKGEFKLITGDGQEMILNGNTVLCGCGRSKKKPFCDGMHQRIDIEKE